MANRLTAIADRLPLRRARSTSPCGRSTAAIDSHRPPPVIILGIDPGLDRTGYAVLNFEKRSVVDAGLIRSESAKPLASRLREIEAGITDVLSEHPIELVAVEELYAHYKHPRTAILMGHARGVLLLAASQHEIEVVSLPATHVKRTLTGNGHAAKTQMQRAILATLKLNVLPEPPDVADALAIAWCAAVTGHRPS